MYCYQKDFITYYKNKLFVSRLKSNFTINSKNQIDFSRLRKWVENPIKH